MPFQITSAASTRVSSGSKRKSVFPQKRSSSSSSSKPKPSPSPVKRKASTLEADDKAEGEADEASDPYTTRLTDLGLIHALAPDASLRDVPQQMQYAQDHMFEALPSGGGFSSTRTAEILNFRRNLPPLVTQAHVHALSKSATGTQREIAELVGSGVLRKISIPARGVGRASIGEAIVLVERWVRYVEGMPGVDDEVKTRYIEALRRQRSRAGVAASWFTMQQVSVLIKAGLLTAASNSGTSYTSSRLGASSSSLGAGLSTAGTLASLSTAGSRAAAGSMEAIGGGNAFMDAGGGGGGFNSPVRPKIEYGPELTFTLPSVGPYLRLLEAARNHIVTLLSRSKYKEAPKYLLGEWWDGSITKPGDPKRKKGFDGVILPANTKKWKQFHGLKFQWVLEECLGTGLVEVFETGSVGQGVRLT